MERLTIKTHKGAVLKMADAYDSQDSARQDLMARYRVAVNRLAAYEDTGLTPEEISEAANRRHDCKIDCLLKEYNAMMDKIQSLGGLDHLNELSQAEKDGRLVVPPCKVGDTVFDMADGTPYETRVLSFSYFGDGFWACRTASSYPDLQEFGKRIFLTREEAEAALKKKKEENI